VSIDRITVLADRGDLAFVELDCASCGSRTMSLVLRDAGPGSTDGPVLDTAAHPELGPIAEARLAGRPPIDEGDVLAVARLLAGWEGDLRSLVEGRGDAPAERAG
jgi:hypothetical protein